MLHIVWMILKFIAILLGIIAGLLLVLVLLLLFCPVRYRAELAKNGAGLREIRARVSVSWFLHAVWLQVCVENGKPSPSVRILGIPVLKLFGRRRNGRRGDPTEAQSEEPPLPEEEIPFGEGSPPEERVETEVPEQSSRESAARPSDSEEMESPREERGAEMPGEEEAGPGDRLAAVFRAIGYKIRDILGRIKRIAGQIRERMREIRLTIRAVRSRTDWWKRFLTHPRTLEALSLVKDRLLHLLRHICPTKIRGHVTFGNEDPSVTGTVLALLGMTMPLHRNCVEITPVFDGTDILEGSLRLKGRIYGFVLAMTALRIYFDKNVKYVIHRWKNKGGQ